MIKANKGKIIIGFFCMFAVLFLSLVIMSPDASAATCKHTTKGTRVKTAATCTSSGKRETYCKGCGKITSTSTIPASGHSTTTTTTKAPTCGATGTSVTKCTRTGCTYSTTKTLAATGNHSSDTRVKTAATCTSSGKRETYCKGCGKITSTSTIPASGHSTTTTTTKAPTCGATGTSVTKCTRTGCTYSTTKTLAATGNHSSATRVKTAATCTSSGLRETYCNVCGKVISTSAIPASGHSTTTTTTKAPTCGATGTSVTKCTRTGCTYSTTKTLAATGNHSTATRVKTVATCTSSGLREIYCPVCSKVTSSSIIPASGHNWTTTTVSPSCTNTGYTRTYCTRCNTNYSYHETGKLGHNYSSPTCIEAQKCRSCGTLGASALGHDYAPATCTESGKCRRCGLKGSPATGHTPNLLSPKVTPATCTTEGKRETFCKKCGDLVYTEPIAKIAHNYQITTKATFYSNGEQTCTGCYATRPIPSTCNHIPAVRIKENATCEKTGLKITYCTICNMRLDFDTIKQLPHDYEIVKAPTSVTEGIEKCKYCPHTQKISTNKLTSNSVLIIGKNEVLERNETLGEKMTTAVGAYSYSVSLPDAETFADTWNNTTSNYVGIYLHGSPYTLKLNDGVSFDIREGHEDQLQRNTNIQFVFMISCDTGRIDVTQPNMGQIISQKIASGGYVICCNTTVLDYLEEANGNTLGEYGPKYDEPWLVYQNGDLVRLEEAFPEIITPQIVADYWKKQSE